jgi:hypothetical protein
MRTFRFLRHPLAILSAFALGFIAWLWRDATAPQGPPGPEGPNVVIADGSVNRRLPMPPGVENAPQTKPGPRETAQVLAKLKPGMTRAEVEGVLGAPAPHAIHPVTVTDGTITYNTTYEADLGPPPTVRPIRPHPKFPMPPAQATRPAAPTVVILQFDATKPGHPLLGIFYPDPLF